MCGLFAAIGENIDWRIIEAMAIDASRRGPYASTIMDHDGSDWRRTAWRGIFTKDKMPSTRKSQVVVGQARLSTTNNHYDTDNNAPFLIADSALVFNGTLAGLEDYTLSDTRILHRAVSDNGLISAINGLVKDRNCAIIYTGTSKISVFRRFQPLHTFTHDSTLYVSSWPTFGESLLPELRVIEYHGREKNGG